MKKKLIEAYNVVLLYLKTVVIVSIVLLKSDQRKCVQTVNYNREKSLQDSRTTQDSVSLGYVLIQIGNRAYYTNSRLLRSTLISRITKVKIY